MTAVWKAVRSVVERADSKERHWAGSLAASWDAHWVEQTAERTAGSTDAWKAGMWAVAMAASRVLTTAALTVAWMVDRSADTRAGEKAPWKVATKGSSTADLWD